MNFKTILFFSTLFLLSSCGVKSKPVVPRDPSLEQYIQEKLKNKKLEDTKKKSEKKSSNLKTQS